MIKTDCVNSHEIAQVVLVWIVVTMPTNHIKWRVILCHFNTTTTTEYHFKII